MTAESELVEAARSSEWDGCRGYVEVDAGYHVCILDPGHRGDCMCGTCGEHFKPTAAYPDPVEGRGAVSQ